MRKMVLLALLLSLYACGSGSNTSLRSSEDRLIATVSVTENCIVGNIKIEDIIERNNETLYRVRACGKRLVYKQVGSDFVKAN